MNDGNTNTLAIQRLDSPATGLFLTNPTNPISGSIYTDSIQGSLSSRIDYIFPCGLLFSNIVNSQVFRTDLLNPTPPSLMQFDDKTASDHLPVMMYFSNPYNTSFQLTSISVSNQLVNLKWQSIPNRSYRVETSSNLTNWTTLATNLTASGTNLVFTTNATAAAQFFRIYRAP